MELSVHHKETNASEHQNRAPPPTKFGDPCHTSRELIARHLRPHNFIIGYLRSVVSETVKMALTADNVSLTSSQHNRLVAEKELQCAVTAVTKWSSSKQMLLNADKCEVTFLSTNSHETNCQPTIIARNTRLLHNPQAKFLGVTQDRLLTFGPDIQSISTKAAARC